jgi:hypothetical protein
MYLGWYKWQVDKNVGKLPHQKLLRTSALFECVLHLHWRDLIVVIVVLAIRIERSEGSRNC